MCGIAGYSIGASSGIDRTLAAQALLAGIAERGADAVGFAYRGRSATVTVRKQRTGASALLEDLWLPSDTAQVLLHVRDYTKGHPKIDANNHPIRHGAVVGVHNGIIENDDELFDRHRIHRAHPEMTVDSEAIFALVDARPGDLSTLEELRGAMATAWLDERDPRHLYLARGVARPLWLGRGRHELFFASTAVTLELVQRAVRVRLRIEQLGQGRFLRVTRGRIVHRERFRAFAACSEPQLGHADGCTRSSPGSAGGTQPPARAPSARTSTPSSRNRSRTRY
jgi:glucosamine 6-phosphate synthetase-like amidotransferase/phosphosugar isomerase protein